MAMIIDIYDYWNRWLINYIVYHKEHLIEYGDVESANTHFSALYLEAISKMNNAVEDAAIASIQANMQSLTSNSAAGLRILSDLLVGTLLDSTLDEIAAGINEGIELAGGLVDFDNYNSILLEARSFNNMLSTRNPNVLRVEDFFNLLLQALDQAKLLDVSILDALTLIGNLLVGTSFLIDSSWLSKTIALSEQDLETVLRIINSLNRAVLRLGAEGTVSSRSFANTISYIFNQTIGNRIGLMIVAEGIKIGIDTADSLLDKAIAKSGGKLSWVDRGDSSLNSINSGTVNIFNQDSFLLKVSKNGLTFNIEIGMNVVARWDNRKRSNSVIQSVARTTVGEYFTNMQEKYLAYNIITHRFTGAQFEESFNMIRASTAASFFNEWVLNNGFKTSDGRTALFLIVKGRVFSVLRIINNICDDILRNGGQGAFDLGISSGQINKWLGGAANLENALKRSNMVNLIIDKFTIAATLNNNILNKYAY